MFPFSAFTSAFSLQPFPSPPHPTGPRAWLETVILIAAFTAEDVANINSAAAKHVANQALAETNIIAASGGGQSVTIAKSVTAPVSANPTPPIAMTAPLDTPTPPQQ